MLWCQEPVRRPDEAIRQRALARQGQLTKPAGALGRLEGLAVHLAALQGRDEPSAARAAIAVFAGDHGVVAEGISAYPQVVTLEMMRNFARGGAAVSVLAESLGAALHVLNVGALECLDEPAVRDRRVAAGTRNFCEDAAMTPAQLAAALKVGRSLVDELAPELDVFLAGEMGIGNTTAASALACALLGLPPGELAGPGTGLDPEGVRRKAQVIGRGLSLHGPALQSPLEALRRVGGLEIAALVGAYLRCGQRGVPVLVDGFICSVAALTAVRLQPGLAPWLLLAHASAEPGHRALIDALGQLPLLDLGLRLGEGSGAALALPLLRLACELHNRMATFAAAGVSTAHGD